MSGAEEVVISQSQGLTFKVTKAADLLQKNGTVTITAINSAISSAVNLVELLKHRIKGLHQHNSFEKVPDSNKTRVVFKLSYKSEDSSSAGYQRPIPEDEVQEKTLDELKKPPWGDRKVDSKDEKEETKTGEHFERRGRWGGRRSGRRGRGRDNFRERRTEDQGGEERGDESEKPLRSSYEQRGGRRGGRRGRWGNSEGNYENREFSGRGDRGYRRGYRRGDSEYVRGERGYSRGDRGYSRGERGERRGGRGFRRGDRGFGRGYDTDRGNQGYRNNRRAPRRSFRQ